MMKLISRVIIVCLIAGLLCGCQTPKKKVAVEEKPCAATLISPGEKTVEEDMKEGKATKEEIAKAIKNEPIPATNIEGKVFVSPSEISEELAKIFQNIHFDFDKYDIRPDARPILNAIGKYLSENPKVEILIEGHCDERGTREYNLVLGEQRALSTRRYLVSLGVSPKRLHTVSYGEDKPLDTASNEEAWAKNRRAEFKIAK
ncbi:MAG: peptidoglycan-associated lipoprotein Pal [bacterium]|nr:peptidoglycan-associated lipoprotein Pal [bacterium]